MSDDKLTPQQFGQIIGERKPYLIELENRVQDVGYGEVEVRLYIRAGVVEKMYTMEGRTWLRDKVDTKNKT